MCFVKEILVTLCILHSSLKWNNKETTLYFWFIRDYQFYIWEYLEQTACVKPLPPGQNLKCLLFSADNQITMFFWRSSLIENAWVLNKCFWNLWDQTEMGNIFWMHHKPVHIFSRPVFPSCTSSKISKASHSAQLTGEMKWQIKVLGNKCLGKRGAGVFLAHSLTEAIILKVSSESRATVTQNTFRESRKMPLHFFV